MPELAALELLVLVARHGSLSAAAREIGLTQQAVSARITSLEAQTGVRLVARTPHGSELTPAGQVAVQWADRLLQVAHEVDAGLATLREGSRFRVRVSASLTVAEQLLPAWLVSMQTAVRSQGRHPLEVVLNATNTDHVVEHVRSGIADVGFIEGPRVPAGLRSRTVARDELVLVVRPDHRWARSPSVTLQQVAATPLVTREMGSGTREFFEAALTRGLGPGGTLVAPALEMSTAASVRAAVLAGSAPAVLSRLAVADDLAAGRLRPVPIEGLNLHRQLRAIWVGDRVPPAGAVRDLLGHIGSSGRNVLRRP